MVIPIKRSGASIRLRCDQVFGDFQNAKNFRNSRDSSLSAKRRASILFCTKSRCIFNSENLGKIVILLQKLYSIKRKGNKLP